MYNLTNDNFYQYAAKGLSSYHTSENEFRLLLKHIVYIKRLIKKYKNNFININTNLLLNHFIIIYNEFDVKIANHILFFEISKIYHPQVKTILLFLNKLKDSEVYLINNEILRVTDIKEDPTLNAILKKVTSK